MVEMHVESTLIDVQYRHMEGYHVFTSEDVYGLYVASKDARKAFDAVAPALELLLEKNYDIAGSTVEPVESFAEFLKSRWPKTEDAPAPEGRSPVLGNQRYLLRRAA